MRKVVGGKENIQREIREGLGGEEGRQESGLKGIEGEYTGSVEGEAGKGRRKEGKGLMG